MNCNIADAKCRTGLQARLLKYETVLELVFVKFTKREIERKRLKGNTVQWTIWRVTRSVSEGSVCAIPRLRFGLLRIIELRHPIERYWAEGTSFTAKDGPGDPSYAMIIQL
jgi:hypothetical protein